MGRLRPSMAGGPAEDLKLMSIVDGIIWQRIEEIEVACGIRPAARTDLSNARAGARSQRHKSVRTNGNLAQCILEHACRGAVRHASGVAPTSSVATTKSTMPRSEWNISDCGSTSTHTTT